MSTSVARSQHKKKMHNLAIQWKTIHQKTVKSESKIILFIEKQCMLTTYSGKAHTLSEQQSLKFKIFKNSYSKFTGNETPQKNG